MENNSFELKDFDPNSTTFLFDHKDYSSHRSVKEVSFPWTNSFDLKKVRIKTILDYNEEKIIETRSIKNIGPFVGNTPKKFRIKSVHGPGIFYLESTKWVENKIIELNKKRINQFRIRAVSEFENIYDQLINTDWIYSNVKNENNESLLFQLLNNFINLTVSDNNIDKEIEKYFEDFVSNLIFEEKIQMIFLLNEKEKIKNIFEENKDLLIIVNKKEEIEIKTLEIINKILEKLLKEFFISNISDKEIIKTILKYEEEDCDVMMKETSRKIEIFKNFKEILQIIHSIKEFRALKENKEYFKENISFKSRYEIDHEKDFHYKQKEISNLNKKEDIQNLIPLKENILDIFVSNFSENEKNFIEDYKKYKDIKEYFSISEKEKSDDIVFSNIKENSIKEDNDIVYRFFNEIKKRNEKKLEEKINIENKERKELKSEVNKIKENSFIEKKEKEYNNIEKSINEKYEKKPKIKDAIPSVFYGDEPVDGTSLFNFILDESYI